MHGSCIKIKAATCFGVTIWPSWRSWHQNLF